MASRTFARIAWTEMEKHLPGDVSHQKELTALGVKIICLGLFLFHHICSEDCRVRMQGVKQPGLRWLQGAEAVGLGLQGALVAHCWK